MRPSSKLGCLVTVSQHFSTAEKRVEANYCLQRPGHLSVVNVPSTSWPPAAPPALAPSQLTNPFRLYLPSNPPPQDSEGERPSGSSARYLAACERTSPLGWLERTIRLGYAIQLATHASPGSGYSPHLSPMEESFRTRAVIAAHLVKVAIEPALLAEMSSGFYSLDFIVSKKRWGAAPHFGPALPEQAHPKLPFRIVFVAIDLKDTYSHVFHSPSTLAIPMVHIRGAGVQIQSPVLRSGRPSPHLYQTHGGCLSSPQRTECTDTQLSQ